MYGYLPSSTTNLWIVLVGFLWRVCVVFVYLTAWGCVCPLVHGGWPLAAAVTGAVRATSAAWLVFPASPMSPPSCGTSPERLFPPRSVVGVATVAPAVCPAQVTGFGFGGVAAVAAVAAAAFFGGGVGGPRCWRPVAGRAVCGFAVAGLLLGLGLGSGEVVGPPRRPVLPGVVVALVVGGLLVSMARLPWMWREAVPLYLRGHRWPPLCLSLSGWDVELYPGVRFEVPVWPPSNV